MFLDIHDLELHKIDFEECLPPGRMDCGPGIRQVGELVVRGSAELLAGEIHLCGSLQTVIERPCDRCLEPAPFPVDGDFELFYRPLSEGLGEEKALDESEAEMGFYEGDGLELDDVLREFVLLTLPMQRVCSEDCKGICPECGKNRNQNECNCHAVAQDDRWAALKNLQ